MTSPSVANVFQDLLLRSPETIANAELYTDVRILTPKKQECSNYSVLKSGCLSSQGNPTMAVTQ